VPQPVAVGAGEVRAVVDGVHLVHPDVVELAGRGRRRSPRARRWAHRWRAGPRSECRGRCGRARRSGAPSATCRRPGSPLPGWCRSGRSFDGGVHGPDGRARRTRCRSPRCPSDCLSGTVAGRERRLRPDHRARAARRHRDARARRRGRPRGVHAAPDLRRCSPGDVRVPRWPGRRRRPRRRARADLRRPRRPEAASGRCRSRAVGWPTGWRPSGSASRRPGVLLARDADGRAVRFDDPTVATASRERHRRARRRSVGLVELCCRRGAAPHRGHPLREPLDHPGGRGPPFDTRFFVARAPQAQEPLHDDPRPSRACGCARPTRSTGSAPASSGCSRPPCATSSSWPPHSTADDVWRRGRGRHATDDPAQAALVDAEGKVVDVVRCPTTRLRHPDVSAD
jgi:hypothetical protein